MVKDTRGTWSFESSLLIPGPQPHVGAPVWAPVHLCSNLELFIQSTAPGGGWLVAGGGRCSFPVCLAPLHQGSHVIPSSGSAPSVRQL